MSDREVEGERMGSRGVGLGEVKERWKENG